MRGRVTSKTLLFSTKRRLKYFWPLHGQEHTDVAASKENIGLVFKAVGKKSEAKQMFTEAAGIRLKVLGTDHHLTKKSERLASQKKANTNKLFC
jgi:hypothetical protein